MTLRQRTALLTSARLIDYGLQLLLPMILARTLAPEEYGRYMLIWLVANSALAITIFQIPQSLYHFVAHARSREEHASVVLNAAVLLTCTGGSVAILLLPQWSILPSRFYDIDGLGILLPAFVLTLSVTQLLDVLPAAEERVRVQAGITVGLSLFRIALLSIIALCFRDVGILLWGLVAFSCFKLVILGVYLSITLGTVKWHVDSVLLRRQVTYIVPFGFATLIYLLSNQSYQWVAASRFSSAQYAMFVIGLYPGSFFSLVKESINSVVLPRMAQLCAAENYSGVLSLSRSTNANTALLLFPLATWFLVAAEDIILTLFSTSYREAAEVMRVFVASYLTQTFEVSNLFRVYRYGACSLWLSILLFLPALAASYFGASQFGVWGAALGAVFVAVIGEIAKLLYVSQRLSVSIREVIDWKLWCTLFLSATVAGAVAMTVSSHLEAWAPLPRAICAGLVTTSAYLAHLWFLQRSLLKSLFSSFRTLQG